MHSVNLQFDKKSRACKIHQTKRKRHDIITSISTVKTRLFSAKNSFCYLAITNFRE